MSCVMVTSASATSLESSTAVTVTVCGVLQMFAPLGENVRPAPPVIAARAVSPLVTATVTSADGAVVRRTW